MALPVDVRSIDDLCAVREALILFAEDAGGALGSMDAEIRRCIDWLTHDQRIYWQGQVKRRSDKLAEAKAELHRKQISNMHGENAHDSEQRENVREAKRRLEEAQEKVELVHRWLPVVERAAMEYGGQARPFADMLEFDVERSIELIDRMIAALEEYTQIAPPETARPAPAPLASAPAPAASAPAAPSAAAPEPSEAGATDEPPAEPDKETA